jgi:hypothetical protein
MFDRFWQYGAVGSRLIGRIKSQLLCQLSYAPICEEALQKGKAIIANRYGAQSRCDEWTTKISWRGVDRFADAGNAPSPI